MAVIGTVVLALIPGKNVVKTVASNLMEDVFASAPAIDTFVHGDVDGNGTVDIRDVARILLYINNNDVDCLNATLEAENDSLHLTLVHKEELLAHKEEIVSLQDEIIRLHKTYTPDKGGCKL